MAEKKKVNTKEMMIQLDAEVDMMKMWHEIEDSATEEERAEMEDALALNATASLQAIEQRIDSIDWVKTQIEYFKAVEQRAKTMKKRGENYIEFVKGVFREYMESIDETSLKAGMRKISIQNTNPSLDVTQEWLVPRKYWKVEKVKTLDKQAIIKDLKAGKKVRGCKLEERTMMKLY